MNSNVSVVLMYYGFPDSVGEMEDYLKDIMGGRQPPKWLIDENIRKLEAIGGETPSIKIVNSIKEKLANALDYPVYLLTKHYKPNIRDAGSIIKEEIVIEVPLFPIYSRQIFDSYYIPLEGSLPGRKFIRIENVGFHKNIVSYYKDKLRSVNSYRIFSAHSQLVKGYDPYPLLFVQNSKAIAEREFMWFYHSQGPFGGRWLGPDMDFMVKFLEKNNINDVIDVPNGFLYEHIEVLYDLDILFRGKLKNHGINFKRIRPISDSDIFINALIEEINKKMNRV